MSKKNALDATLRGLRRCFCLTLMLPLGGCAGFLPHLFHTDEPEAASVASAAVHIPPAPVEVDTEAPTVFAAQPRPPREPSPYKDLLGYAMRMEGQPYRFGGTNARTGFDCSGFVRAVFGEFGIALPRDARTMAAALPEIPREKTRAGDLVFFNTRKKAYSHVGIYLGNNLFVHASSSKTRRVMVSDMTEPYWRKRFNGVRRAPLGTGLAQN